jgi:hypothetical protein
MMTSTGATIDDNQWVKLIANNKAESLAGLTPAAVSGSLKNRNQQKSPSLGLFCWFGRIDGERHFTAA